MIDCCPKRVGTTYIPVTSVSESATWYRENLGAEVVVEDEIKAIIKLADQSFFLVKAQEDASANFRDKEGKEHFSLTFEVDGVDALRALHSDLQSRDVAVGEIEDLGHAGAVRLCCQKGEETML
jgi:catechol-2,3-dioxygenase